MASKDKITEGTLFLGQEEMDPGEYGWDGKVWLAPSPGDIAEAEAAGMDPEPWDVATFESEADARLFIAARGLLKSLKELLPYARKAILALNATMVGCLYPAINLAMLERAESAICEAEGTDIG